MTYKYLSYLESDITIRLLHSHRNIQASKITLSVADALRHLVCDRSVAQFCPSIHTSYF